MRSTCDGFELRISFHSFFMYFLTLIICRCSQTLIINFQTYGINSPDFTMFFRWNPMISSPNLTLSASAASKSKLTAKAKFNKEESLFCLKLSLLCKTRCSKIQKQIPFAYVLDYKNRLSRDPNSSDEESSYLSFRKTVFAVE